MPRDLFDSEFVLGVHDRGAEMMMREQNSRGWVLVTEAVGSDPNGQGGGNYSDLANDGFGVMVRLNNGYKPDGTIPFESKYRDFAQRCANFVRASSGARIWIIGNETNYAIEWPGVQWDDMQGQPASPDRAGEVITPARYAQCFKLVRTAIRAQPGHERDWVLPAAVAPWNNYIQNFRIKGLEDGDWVKYFQQMLQAIGPSGCDGITLHTYVHGYAPDDIESEQRMDSFPNRRYQFRAFQDFMEAIPADMRGLPVFITEFNPHPTAAGSQEGWRDENRGLVMRALREIERWNAAQPQKVRSLILFRWSGDARWRMDNKGSLLDDVRAAMRLGLKWPETQAVDLWAPLRQRLEALEAEAKPILAGAQKARDSATALSRSVMSLDGLQQQSQAVAGWQGELNRLQSIVADLERFAKGDQPSGQPPAMQDVHQQLPTHATARFAARSRLDIRRIVVHHTGNVATPLQFAQSSVRQGKPGLNYHFLIDGDGAIFWTQPLEALVTACMRPENNADSVALALMGDFNPAPPSPAQMDAAARLVAWLLDDLGIGPEAVVGRIELADSAAPSPGRQWLEGARYKVSLLQAVNAYRQGARPDDGADISQLRQQIASLQQQLTSLQQQLTTAQAEAAQSFALRQQLSQRDVEIQGLRAELARRQDGGAPGVRIEPPAMVDVVDSLPKKADATPFPQQDPASVTRIVISHSGSDKSVMPEAIARAYIRGGWWGIGYHFVITPDGTIYQCQRLTTAVNQLFKLDFNTVEVCLVGYFMRLKNNVEQPREDQLPTEAQMAAAGRLLAWLRQELPLTDANSIVGRKELQAHASPGEEWTSGANWKQDLLNRVESARIAAPVSGAKPIKHYLLFWDHGGDAWARADWRNAQDYIEHFRPTTGFSVADAMQAEHVTIVGGYGGVLQEEGERLKAAGVILHRLAGSDEAATQALLDQLVMANVPWPEDIAAGLGAGHPADFDFGVTSSASDLGEIDVPKRRRRRSKTKAAG